MPLSFGFLNMEKPSFKLVGAPCGQHGQYTFYKAIRLMGDRERIVAIGDFFFVRIWQDSELVSIGELQLLWTDRVSDQTLVSLRLYFLPENTPDGRNLQGEDEVLAINDKVVVRAEDLLSWVSDGSNWTWGLHAVWRGACAPPADPRHTAPLHHTKLDFSDVEREKSTIAADSDYPGVVVFSYPRYCRYRALLARLEGIQADWLRDSLVAALGGYAAPTKNTRILYCKDTFEYPELEGHEFVCNHLAPRLKGRPRGRRRRAARSRSRSPSRSPSSSHSHSRSSDSDRDARDARTRGDPMTPRRLSLRNGAPPREPPTPPEATSPLATAEDKAFLVHLRHFYTQRNLHLNTQHTLKHWSLLGLYRQVCARGGYEAVSRARAWPSLSAQPARTRRHYERFLLQYENHERRNGILKINGKTDEPHTIATIDMTDSPLRDIDNRGSDVQDKVLRTPSPKHENNIDNETGEVKEELNITSKPAEELNREFLDSLPKGEDKFKISVKPVEKLIEPKIVKLFEQNSALISELVSKHNLSDSSKVIAELGSKQLSRDSTVFLSELAEKLDLSTSDGQKQFPDGGLATITVSDKSLNGHEHAALQGQQKSRPAGRSSLRAVRVKPARGTHVHPHSSHTHTHTQATTPPVTGPRPDSGSSSPPSVPLNNFGIHHPPLVKSSTPLSDDEIVEVPYKPKTPEIIDLDEYPESPQSVKKKKLDILKERGLEVTALPTANWTQPPLNPAQPLLTPPMILNPAMQHQIMTQAQLFQMYNIIPPNYSNGIQPPKVIQGTSIFGSAGPEKTVYGNPKDPFMPPPHILLGTPVKSQRNIPQTSNTPPQDVLDLTCRDASPQKPAVEIVRVSTPSKTSQNLAKNYTLIDGKAVVGSNLEITLVNKSHQSQSKNRPPQKRSSNGKFMSTKTPTPPKEYPKPTPSGVQKKPQIIVPNYQINRDDISPTSSSGSTNSQSSLLPNYKTNLSQIMEMQKSVPMASFMDPYMALYSSLAGQMDQRQLAAYRDLMTNQIRGYSGLLHLGAVANTPTTKN